MTVVWRNKDAGKSSFCRDDDWIGQDRGARARPLMDNRIISVSAIVLQSSVQELVCFMVKAIVASNMVLPRHIPRYTQRAIGKTAL